MNVRDLIKKDHRIVNQDPSLKAFYTDSFGMEVDGHGLKLYFFQDADPDGNRKRMITNVYLSEGAAQELLEQLEWVFQKPKEEKQDEK